MLSQLRIQNLAVVEDATLSFEDGLNVLTGSTGAGKSLILSAVNLLLGERGNAKVIRAGEDKAVVEGIFRLARPVDSVFVAISSPVSVELILRREIHRSGRSYAFVDGKSCPLKQLQEIAQLLIEPHGQNEQLQLKYADNHVVYVDKLAQNDKLIEGYRTALDGFRESEQALSAFESRIALAKERKELLEHRIEEIDRAELDANEKAELESSIRLLENAQDIYDALSQANALIFDDETAAVNLISQAARRIEKIRPLGDKFDGFAAQLDDAEIRLKETASEMRAFLEHQEFEPERLEQMQERLAYLIGLERRYNTTIADLIDTHANWKSEIESIAFEDEERDRLRTEKEKALGAVDKAARKLSESRRKAAATLDKAMTGELEQLMMRGARFRTNLTPELDPSGELVIEGRPVRLLSDGIDDVIFQVRTNPGESEGSVADIASSGELSRIALALKKIVTVGREGSVLVFDELDAGVGADLGDMIAGKLEAIAGNYQIICITHMPQVAAKGRRHLVVRKSSREGRTFTYVERAEGEARVEEIARMLGGSDGSEKRLALAQELLQLKKGKSSISLEDREGA